VILINSSNSFVGINVQGMKKLGVDLLEYSEELRKIKNNFDNIESKLRNSFSGEAANFFDNSFKNFGNNILYLSKNIKNYSDYCEEIIRRYQIQDTNSFNIK